jgi:thiamine-monophosphate kinase
MDEFEFISALTERFTRDGAAGVPWVDIGDDAAVLHADARPLVVSVDASVEGVHFLRDFAPAEDLGYRALMAAGSDLGAMGAEPESALLALIIAPGTPRDWLLALVDGYAEAAEVCGLRVVGGNVSRGNALSMTTTVLGRLPEGALPLRRQGAQLGDDVYVSGPVGGAALGLAAIRAGTTDHSDATRECVRRWRRPCARLSVGAALRGLATSAIDLSDGLLQDLTHVALASGVGLELRLADIPVVDGFAHVCAHHGLAPEDTALTGGEDYELAFTAPRAQRDRVHTLLPGVARIGDVVATPGVRVLDARGRMRDANGPAGFRHEW